MSKKDHLSFGYCPNCESEDFICMVGGSNSYRFAEGKFYDEANYAKREEEDLHCGNCGRAINIKESLEQNKIILISTNKTLLKEMITISENKIIKYDKELEVAEKAKEMTKIAVKLYKEEYRKLVDLER